MRADLDLEYRDKLRRRAQELARLVLSGKVDILEASKSLWVVLQRLGLGWEDEDSSAFGLIVSETDHLPVGRERQYWAKEALERKEPEIVGAKRWAEQFGIPACRRIERRWKSP